MCHEDSGCKQKFQDYKHWIKEPCGNQFYIKNDRPLEINMVVNLNHTFLITRQNLTDFISANNVECPLKELTIVKSKKTFESLDPNL